MELILVVPCDHEASFDLFYIQIIHSFFGTSPQVSLSFLRSFNMPVWLRFYSALGSWESCPQILYFLLLFLYLGRRVGLIGDFLPTGRNPEVILYRS